MSTDHSDLIDLDSGDVDEHRQVGDRLMPARPDSPPGPYDVAAVIDECWDDLEELNQAYRVHRGEGGTDAVWNQAVDIAQAERLARGAPVDDVEP